jgi:hypothetical protein
MITGSSIIIKNCNLEGNQNHPAMLKFFQVLFLIASIVLIVLNILDYNRFAESKRHPEMKPYPIKWFSFILTSLVALGCALNVIIGWITAR